MTWHYSIHLASHYRVLSKSGRGLGMRGSPESLAARSVLRQSMSSPPASSGFARGLATPGPLVAGSIAMPDLEFDSTLIRHGRDAVTYTDMREFARDLETRPIVKLLDEIPAITAFRRRQVLAREDDPSPAFPERISPRSASVAESDRRDRVERA